MTRSIGVLAVTIPLLLWTGSVFGATEDWSGNVNLYAGYKGLDDEDWFGVDDHVELGLSVDVRPASWPVSITVQYFGSRSPTEMFRFPAFLFTDTRVRAWTREAHLGVRKTWEASPHTRPFIGGGVASIRGEVEVITDSYAFSEHDTTIGPWAEAGLYWTLAGHFNIGLDARWSQGDVELLDEDQGAGGNHVAAFLGGHW
jgi:hypothetical protein